MGNIPPFPDPNQLRAQREMWKAQMRAQKAQMRAYRYQWKAQRRSYRRGSILGPMLLIGFGVLVLLVHTGKLPAFLLWEWYGKHWPLLLVAAGIVLLIEWGIDLAIHRTDAQGHVIPVRRGLGGGAAFLLILLAIAGVAASGKPDINWSGLRSQLNMDEDMRGWNPFLGEKHEDTQDATVPLAANASVSIESPRGDVTVAGTSDDGQVHIQYHKTVYAGSDNVVDERLRSLDTQVLATTGNLDLHVPQVEGGTVDMVVTLPASTALTIKAGNGDLHISAMKSALMLSSDRGDMQVEAITGPVSARMSHGDFVAQTVTGPVAVTGHMNDVTVSQIDGPVTLDGDFFGDMHLEHIRGTMHLHSSRTDLQVARLDGSLTLDSGDLTADSILGPVTLKTRSKDISLTQVAGDVRVEDSNGDVSVTSAPPLGNVDVGSSDGAVSVTVPEGAAFTVQGTTHDGDVTSDFSGLNVHSGSNGSLSGSVGGGGAVQVRMSAGKGDIDLKKADIAPLAPLPPLAPKLSLTPPAGNVAPPKAPKAPAAPKAPPAVDGSTHEY